MRREAKTGCLAVVALSLATAIVVGTWDLLHQQFDPSVAAIRDHPIAATGTVIQPEIDGLGGDPAVSYHYSVGGHIYDGYDVASSATGDVLRLKAGDHVPIQYAAAVPSVSCVAASTDCPNGVFDPYLAAFVFWALALVLVFALGCQRLSRHLRKRSRGAST
ncbi:MAG: hypothetical protein DLM65_11605 [Candidatus Aeolococcus gillhamiae]|uniref:DUF3592 domain-containing protein n=1 Tax=Candidatus Aeolococcus gillhamiae TaxID=3127015 RepID=A0A2W5Z143_9BACT|nr:MAG: hypothetical protein DLM65_11605 [Candidatus Dormibacter sp. RRmetagenome_bin12]